ncbi:MAG: transposase [Pyrinomonadaceae bacterium]
MLDDYGFEIYEENTFPIAYLLTFRTYGTWLHGNECGSIERSRDKRFRVIYRTRHVPLEDKMISEMKTSPTIFNRHQKSIVNEAIKEVCEYRQYTARAVNVRSNHVHAVISKAIEPEKIVNDLKAYATRKLRAEHAIDRETRVWSRGASTRYLWKPRHVDAAVEYVLYGQGDVPFETVFDMSQP